MKTSFIRKVSMMFVVAVATMLGTGYAKAQQKVAEKELIGVWIMDSYCYEGEEKVVCGKDYSQVKVYRANGEYACAELVKLKDGTCKVLPHEYGTYSFKDGKYVEMGRDSNLNLEDKNTFTGHWKNRHDVWKKSKDMPDRLVDYIVDLCKINQGPSDDIHQMIRKYIMFR